PQRDRGRGHARPRPGAGRDDRHRPDPGLQLQDHDPDPRPRRGLGGRPHRQQLRRGGRRPAPRPGGRRPGAVRDHPHRQHRRPDHREPDQQGKDGGLTVSAVPAAALPQPRKVRRSVREVVERPLMIAAVVGVAMALIFAVTLLSGVLGWALCTYVGFVVLDSFDCYRTDGPVVAKDRIATVLVSTAGLCTVVPLILIVAYVLSKGLHGVTRSFFTETLEKVGPADPATVGGAKHAIIGTIEQVGLATILATPLGLMTAVHLTESRGRLARVTRVLVDAMSGIPSIVAGLFIY